MNQLIIDIRENVVRAVVIQDGVPGYAHSFEHAGAAPDADADGVKSPTALELPEILKAVRSECGCPINETHLILPPDEVISSQHTTPKLSRGDAEILIKRKIVSESKEEFPPFSIMPGGSDQKTQTWISQYVPSGTIKRYQKLFSASKLKLKSITTPVNAMLDAFRNVREAIFNAHAIFEIVGGSVEAYYISSDGILHSERIPYLTAASGADKPDVDAEKALKQLLFKIINTIFRINSHYQIENPTIPVQLAWICGDVKGLEEIATALKEAMSVEVAIAPAIPSGMENESGYVPLAGFAASLQNSTAVTYHTVPLFRRFPLRKTYGIALYTLTTAVALLAFGLTEREYRMLKKQVAPVAVKQGKDKPVKSTPGYLKNLEILKKLTGQQMVFYPLFRELANNLPDGALLETIDYRFKDDKGLLVITALVSLGNKVGTTDVPGRLMAMIDSSAMLRNHREPAISTVVKGKDTYLKIIVTSEVKAFDSTK